MKEMKCFLRCGRNQEHGFTRKYQNLWNQQKRRRRCVHPRHSIRKLSGRIMWSHKLQRIQHIPPIGIDNHSATKPGEFRYLVLRGTLVTLIIWFCHFLVLAFTHVQFLATLIPTRKAREVPIRDHMVMKLRPLSNMSFFKLYFISRYKSSRAQLILIVAKHFLCRVALSSSFLLSA